MQMGRCCACTYTAQPFLWGVPKVFSDAVFSYIDTPTTIINHKAAYQQAIRDLFAAEVGYGLVFYNLPPNQIPLKHYPLKASQYLHGVFLGYPFVTKKDPFSGSNPFGSPVTNYYLDSSATVHYRVANAMDLIYVPEEGSDEDDAIMEHLSHGRVVLLNVDIPQIFSKDGYVSDGVPEHTTEFLYSGIRDKVDEINAYLYRMGSETSVIIRRLKDMDVPVIPESGYDIPNPNNWLGSNLFTNGITDYTLQATALANPAGGGYFDIPMPAALPTSTIAWEDYDVGGVSTGGMLELSCDNPDNIFLQRWRRIPGPWDDYDEPAFRIPVVTCEKINGGYLIVCVSNADHIHQTRPWGYQPPTQIIFDALNRKLHGSPFHRMSGQLETASDQFRPAVVATPLSTETSWFFTTPDRSYNLSVRPTSLFANVDIGIDSGTTVLFAKVLGAGVLAGSQSNSGQGFLFETEDPGDPDIVSHKMGIDITESGWTGTPDNIDKYSNINDDDPADTESYIWTANDSTATYEGKFNSISISAGSHIVRYTAARLNDGELGSVDGGGVSGTLDVHLVKGTTILASDTTRTLSGDWVEYTWTLGTDEIDDINKSTGDIRLRFVATGTAAGVGITQAVMDVAVGEEFDVVACWFWPEYRQPCIEIGNSPYLEAWRATHPTYTTVSHVPAYDGTMRACFVYTEAQLVGWGMPLLTILRLNAAGTHYSGTPLFHWWSSDMCDALDDPDFESVTVGFEEVSPTASSEAAIQKGGAVLAIRTKVPSAQISGTVYTPSIPVVFQNGKYLIPPSGDRKKYFARVSHVPDGFTAVTSTLMASWAAWYGVKGWRDVTNFPEEGDPVDLEFGPTAPPMIIGKASVIRVRSGINGNLQYSWESSAQDRIDVPFRRPRSELTSLYEAAYP